MSSTDRETICHALGVEDRTEKQKQETAIVLGKLLHMDNYTVDCAIVDMFVIYGIHDTPEARKIAAEMYTLGASVETAAYFLSMLKEK